MPVPMTTVFVLSLAAAVSGGLSALAARSLGRGGTAAPWWGGLAVGLAYALGHAGVAPPAWPPVDVTDRIPVIALFAALVEAILAGDRGGARGRVVGYLGLAAVSWVAIMGPVLGAGEISRETTAWLAGTAIVASTAAINLAFLDTPSRRSELQAALAVYALGTGVVLVLANSAILLQLGGVLALALAAALLGARGKPGGGGVAAGLAVLIALIIEGFVYAFLPASAALVLALGPATLWLSRLGVLDRLGPKARGSVAVGLILVPVVVAIGLIMASKPSDDYGY